MRVFVSGASGYVGSHTVAALLRDGHRVRALVRDPGKATKVLGALGVPAEGVELVPGDMLDPGAVADGMSGCDAAIHAAAAIGVTGGGGDVVGVNVAGTRNVVGGAVAAGLAPVVHVSTVAVFVPPAAPVITVDAPPAVPRTAYGRSKVIAERYARGLQDDGAPVAIVYPGGVCGPGQPSPDALMQGLAAGMTWAWPLPGGGVGVLDVRDLAAVLARAVTADAAGRRWLLGGHYLTWRELSALCGEVTGVPCRRFPLPDGALLAAGSLLDAARRVRPFGYPLTRDAAEFMVRLVPTDDTATYTDLGLAPRPVRVTVADSVRWLAATGRLAPRRAGRLAPQNTVKETSMPNAAQRVVAPAVQKMAGSAWFARVGPKVVPRLDRVISRVTKGRFLISQTMVPSLVLTARGAVSGAERAVPLACLPEPDGGWLVVGSNFGREKHPAWTGNLLAHPDASVLFRGRTTPVTARLLDGAERAEVWPRLTAVWPVYARYGERSGRTLRVFRLSPR
ncbi:nitroreductase family deazaflavin-dependent oxidoreductase [Actinomadura flavalba]|uniref:nitroreductase family deazaflavin-dependent oxidoreductase n=1 Tax=Actinomadura flavalba TaxID=1120938 RepID=UPI0003A30FF2|nr:nitroreductase family deazaflavin-dependent oxidoreductase [Actinomadura flavalba]